MPHVTAVSWQRAAEGNGPCNVQVADLEEPLGFERVSRVFTLRAVLGGLLCFSGTFVFGVMEPNLAQHLHQAAGMSQPAVGLVFACMPRLCPLAPLPFYPYKASPDIGDSGKALSR